VCACRRIKGLAPEGKEIRLDFAEMSSVMNEFVRYSILNMIELKHDQRNAGAHPELRQIKDNPFGATIGPEEAGGSGKRPSRSVAPS